MTKKDFSVKKNPAIKFITTEDEQQPSTTAVKTSSKVEKERKTRRLNLLMQPSVIEGLSKIAYMRKTSINDLLNSLARDYVNEHSDTVNQYDTVFEE